MLDKKLEWLAQHAEDDVSINSVIGAGVSRPGDAALTITRRASELGFDTSVGVIHDHTGQLRGLPETDKAVYDEIQREREPGFWAFAYDNLFQRNLVSSRANVWQCHAGKPLSVYLRRWARPLLFAAAKGIPCDSPGEGTRLPDLEREYSTVKPCAPYCTVSCVHRVAMIDLLREKPREALVRFFPPQAAGAAAQNALRREGAVLSFPAARQWQTSKRSRQTDGQRGEKSARGQFGTPGKINRQCHQ